MHQAKTMGTKFVALFALAVAAIMAVGATATSAYAFENAQTQVILNPSKAQTITVGSSITLKATTQAEEGHLEVLGTPEITWISSKPSVATVASGKVTGKAAGTADITVTYTYKQEGAEDRIFSATNQVTVKKCAQSLKIGVDPLSKTYYAAKRGAYKGKLSTTKTVTSSYAAAKKAFKISGNKSTLQFSKYRVYKYSTKSKKYVAVSTTGTYGKYFTIGKTGKIYAKKGLPKGTYKVTVKVYSPKTAVKYNSATKYTHLKVKVK